MNPPSVDLITPHTLSLLLLSLAAYPRDDVPGIPGLSFALASVFLSPPAVASTTTQAAAATATGGHQATAIPMFEPSLDKLCVMLEKKSPSLKKINIKENLTAMLKKITSIDGLYDFFGVIEAQLKLEENVLSGPVDRHSAFGMFFRKSVLIFNEMSFEQISALFDQFKEYCNCPDTTMAASHTTPPWEQEGGQMMGLSRINQLIDQQVEQLESSRCLLPPREYQAVLDYLEARVPAAIKVVYLGYLNCLRMGEFIGAVDHLHRYFDYYMASHTPVAGLLQYAVLNMAALYARFGFRQEAVKALNEVIWTARMLNDHECLTQAQHWLHLLSKHSFQTSASGNQLADADHKRTLDSLLARSKDLQLTHLHSLAQLSFSEHHLLQGSSPRETFASLESHTPSSSAAAAATGTGSGGSTGAGGGGSIGGSGGMLATEGSAGSNYLLRSVAWQSYGNTAISSLYSNLQAEHHPHEVNAPDFYHSACKKAATMAAVGDRKAVFEIFDRLRSNSPLSPEWKTWVAAFGQTLLTLCLDRGEHGNAEALLSSLHGMSTSYHAGIVSKVDEAMLRSQTGRHQEAYALLQEVSLESQSLVVTQGIKVEIILQIAQVFIDCHHPLASLPYILKALALSDEFYLATTMTETLLLLGNVLLYFELADQARALADGLLPHVSAHGSAKQKGQLHLLLAKFHLCRTSPEALPSAVRELTTCAEEFRISGSHLQLTEALYLLARVHHDLGNVEERNHSAAKFREMSLKHARAASAPVASDVKYFHLDGRLETFVGH